MNMPDGSFGMELILDLYNVDASLFNKDFLSSFVKGLCLLAKMEPIGEPLIWEDKDSKQSHIQGISLVQFITTSNIIIHTLTQSNLVLINFFSCKPFNSFEVINLALKSFKTDTYVLNTIKRGSKFSELK